MALVDVTKFFWPRLFFTEAPNSTLDANAGDTLSFTANTHALAWVGQAPRDLTISSVSFRMATVTTGCTLDVRIETMNTTTRRPSGSLYAANANGAVVVANTDDNVWKTATLTTPVVITRGSSFCIVMRVSAGTPNMQFAGYNELFAAYPKLPIVANSSNSGATWSSSPPMIPSWFINSGTDAHELECLTPFFGGLAANSVNVDSTPNEYALKITVPFNCRVIGAKILTATPGSAATHRVAFYDADSNIISSVDLLGASSYVTDNDGYKSYYSTTAIELAAGDEIIIGIRAQATGLNSTLTIPTITVNSDGANASPMCTCSLMTRTWSGETPGAWTENTSAYLMAALIIDQISDGVSAPSYFVDNEPVPYPEINMQPQLLVNNIFAFGWPIVDDATGWTDSDNGAFDRLVDPYANVVWEADENTASGTLSFPHVVSANAIGIARHELDGHTVTIEYSDDNGATWYVAGTFAPTAGRIMFQALDGVFTANLWRFTIEGDTPAQISHMSVGVVTAFERRMYAGVVPSLLNREAKMSVGSGSGGQHVGDRFLRERVRQTFDVKNLSGEWVRVMGKPLLEFARGNSVFAAWRPGKYPLDVVYGWSDGDVTTSHSGPASYMDFDITIEGIDSWQN